MFLRQPEDFNSEWKPTSNNNAAILTKISDQSNLNGDPSVSSASISRRRHLYLPSERESKLSKEPLYVPSSICCPKVQDPFGRATISPVHSWSASSAYSMRFAWLEQQKNNSSGETSSRKVASKETSRREVENWYYMHFRFRMEGYQSLVYAVKQSVKEESIFSEDHIDKWTLKLRFRIRRSSPLKDALIACASRLGLDCNPDVVFCLDGFFGDALTGRLHNKNEIPNRIVQPTSTCRAMGLCNGSCVFVSRATRSERANAAIQMQLDLLRHLEVESSESGDASLDISSRTSTLGEAIARASTLLVKSKEGKEVNVAGLESFDFRQVDNRRAGYSATQSESETSSGEIDIFGRFGSSHRKTRESRLQDSSRIIEDS